METSKEHPRKSRALSIASGLCWLSGSVMIASSAGGIVGAFLRALSTGTYLLEGFRDPNMPAPLVIALLLVAFVMGILFCLCGRGISRRSRSWVLTALILSGVFSGIGILSTVLSVVRFHISETELLGSPAFGKMFIQIGAFICLLIGRKHLREPNTVSVHG